MASYLLFAFCLLDPNAFQRVLYTMDLWYFQELLRWWAGRLDVAFGEDKNQASKIAQLKTFRSITCWHWIFTQDTEANNSIKLKRVTAGWDNDKLQELISSIVLTWCVSPASAFDPFFFCLPMVCSISYSEWFTNNSFYLCLYEATLLAWRNI